MFMEWHKITHQTSVAQITKSLLENYQSHLFHYRKKDGKPLAIASQHSRLSHLKVWFKWLARRGHISQDPASELELPRISYKLPKVLNKEEAEIVMQQPRTDTSLGIRDRAILEILYSTGVRRMELLNLKLYEIDQNHGLMTIREGKGKRDRIVPVGERALFWLNRYLAEVRPTIAGKCINQILFLTVGGELFTPNHLSWLTRRYITAAEIGKSGACHIFRHTMATLMLEGGADIRYIQAMLGHVRLDTTQIYTHVSIRMLKHVHTVTHPAARLDTHPNEVKVPPHQIDDDGGATVEAGGCQMGP